jgi:hypothetical protein
LLREQKLENRAASRSSNAWIQREREREKQLEINQPRTKNRARTRIEMHPAQSRQIKPLPLNETRCVTEPHKYVQEQTRNPPASTPPPGRGEPRRHQIKASNRIARNKREREREIGESEIAPALPRLLAGLSVLLRYLFEWDWVLAWAWLAPKVFMHTDPRTNTAVREKTCVNSPCILFFFSLSRELNCISGFSCVKRQASRFWCQIKALLDDGGLFGGQVASKSRLARRWRPSAAADRCGLPRILSSPSKAGLLVDFFSSLLVRSMSFSSAKRDDE